MIEIIDDKSPEGLADYVEFHVTSSGKNISKSKISKLFPEVEEKMIDSVFNELENRDKQYGNSSPILLERTRIKPNFDWRVDPALMLCLIFSLQGVEKKKGKDDGTKLFERLSREVAKNYLSGEAEVIGFPTGSNLKEQINGICKKTYEASGPRSPSKKAKDEGVDIIAWKSHGDNRPNQVMMLLQCAAGVHYDTKIPISLTKWRELINFSATPLRGIVLPHILSNEDWEKVRDHHELIFDRIRVQRALHGKKLDSDLKKQMIEWCSEKIKASS